MINDYTKTLQAIELCILKEFQRICKENNLRYFAIGGTCLGAIRHKGFIPWDDDIDVAMPWEDYKQFIKIATKQLKPPLELYLPEDHKVYQFNFMKIHRGDSLFIRKDYIGYPDRYMGVFFDIMPIYGMSKSKAKQYFDSLSNDMLLYLNRAHRLPIGFYSGTKWRIIWRFTHLLYSNRDYNYFVKRIENKIGKYEFDNSDKVIFAWRKRPSFLRKNYHYQNVFYYEDFKEGIEIPFEDTTIVVPVGYDRYLTMDYGDYMKLPPIEQQICHQDSAVLDLNHSYKDYQTGIIQFNQN